MPAGEVAAREDTAMQAPELDGFIKPAQRLAFAESSHFAQRKAKPGGRLIRIDRVQARRLYSAATAIGGRGSRAALLRSWSIARISL